VTQTETQAQSTDAPPTQPPVGKVNLGTTNIPAIPFWLGPDGKADPTHVADTLTGLGTRAAEGAYAYHGLSQDYTIAGQTAKAYEFLYGGDPGQPSDPKLAPLTQLALDKADEFTLPWTSFGDVYTESDDLRDPFSNTLKSSHKDDATRLFWPTIANFGIPYNLLLLTKVVAKRKGDLVKEFGAAWSAGVEAAYNAGRLFEINTKILENIKSSTPTGSAVRFAPGSITLLIQDEQKELKPEAIKLFSGETGNPTRTYTKGDNAWMYALQAAKASITVWGIWLGHVAHWHIPTAAMQMTMYNVLAPTGHRLLPLLLPQSQFLIDFDFVLLEVDEPNNGPPVWDAISPPTPLPGSAQLLALLDAHFAGGRDFFLDDPVGELRRKGIVQADFTAKKAWDMYPLAGYLSDIYALCRTFVDPVVKTLYPGGDPDVEGDKDLQAWLTASRDPAQGNVVLEAIETRDKLIDLLTSLLYRVTAHAAGSLTPVVNPALAFVSNFPPCLQSTDMPQPGDNVSDADLLALMPHTGTMGQMTTFYFTFAYSLPYVPAIPFGGIEAGLYWPDPGTPQDKACNAALMKYRSGIEAFVKAYTAKWNAALALIAGSPRHIPAYADPDEQAAQWPRSIEI
jgi:hypothetical protein